MILSKSKISLIQSLKQKKCRDENKLFVVEGEKLVDVVLSSDLDTQMLLFSNKFQKYQEYKNKVGLELYLCTEDELKKVSHQKTPSGVLLVSKMKKPKQGFIDCSKSIVLVLDDIQDPGNLGTIIRLSAWFAIEHIVCSPYTADLYNQKAIQSTMGAFLTTNVVYMDLEKFFESQKINENLVVYGTFLNGSNIYSTQLQGHGIIVIGNEGSGISRKIEKYINQRITIPSFSVNTNGNESLNAAMATAVVLSEFRRRT